MLTKDFWYSLPPEKIAQEPARPRDHSKLMILDCTKQTINHRHFYDLAEYLQSGDLLVINDTKVFKARLIAVLERSRTTQIEIFLLRPQDGEWIALAKPGRKLKIGDAVIFADHVKARVENKDANGTIKVKFEMSEEQVFALADKIGDVPTPPYIHNASKAAADYQTVYAQKIGSAAAPTAGFHFTVQLMEELKNIGVKFATVTLHVGLGTFRPVQTEKVEDHVMHEEWINVPRETLDLIAETKKRGRRVIAVGTTSVRSLESDMMSGFTKIFITPGYKFKVVDGMITNFHLPESTLLMLVSAFAQNKMTKEDQGRKFVLKAYQEAILNKYRFYSFGDAMFLF